MILNKKYVIGAVALAIALGFSGCAGGYEPVPNMAKLDAKFADSKWDGQKIPMDQVCFTDTAATPPLTITNVPQGANAILMEVNDENYSPLSSGGGHGIIGFWIDKGSSTVTLPAVIGHTADVPKGTFVEANSRSKGRYATRGYLPPCSGGRNHMYSADIKAVYKAKKDDEKSKLLGTTHIKFGRY